MNGPHEERSGQSAKLEYRPPVEDAGWARASAARIVMWTIVGLGCLGVLLASTLLPSIGLRGRVPPYNRVKCASNLRQIGLACILYAYADPQGRFPPSFEVVFSTQDITSEVFCCPSSADERATGATTQATVAQLSAGGHLSYVYVGSAVKNSDAANVVIAYEFLKNHGNGMNVLFADGHVEWFTAAQGQALSTVAQTAAGKKITWNGKATVGALTQPSGG